MDYVEAAKLYASNSAEPNHSTGSPQLDTLIGGIRGGLLYHFYGEKQLIEPLLRHITVNALKPRKQGPPVVAYLHHGNYRRERTDLGIEELAELAEDSGFQVWEALRRVRVFTASSADQQAQLSAELERLLRDEPNVCLVIARGIINLQRDDARKRNRHVVREEVQRSITRLRQLCLMRGIPIVASGREARVRGVLLPQPESSSYLRHGANVVVYLRRRGRGAGYNRAYLLKHPLRSPGAVEYTYQVDMKLGRETKPFRQSFQEHVERLRREVKDPLMDEGRKTAFDQLVEAWAGEQGAMSYAESFKTLDLMLLVAALDNRSHLDGLERQVKALSHQVKRLQEAGNV